MKTLNQVTVMGRLGRDPEFWKAGDEQMVHLVVATHQGFGKSKKVHWHRIVAFGKTAERCQKYLRKGSLCLVEGAIRYSTYRTKDGQLHYRSRILAHEVTFITKPNASSTQTTSEQVDA